MPAPPGVYRRPVAEAAPGRRAVGQAKDLPAPPLGVGFDLNSRHAARPQLRLDHPQGLLLHALAIDRRPVQQVLRRGLPDVRVHPLPIKFHRRNLWTSYLPSRLPPASPPAFPEPNAFLLRLRPRLT